MARKKEQAFVLQHRQEVHVQVQLFGNLKKLVNHSLRAFGIDSIPNIYIFTLLRIYVHQPPPSITIQHHLRFPEQYHTLQLSALIDRYINDYSTCIIIDTYIHQ